jgi:Asp-tRNA(Asn)/Glu-tRNA(Gln) amidotransferase A subunit family amidase
MDLAYASIAELARHIAARNLSPIDLLDTLLSRIDRYQILNAFITVTREASWDQAEKAAVEITNGQYRGSLHGIPVSLSMLNRHGS